VFRIRCCDENWHARQSVPLCLLIHPPELLETGFPEARNAHSLHRRDCQTIRPRADLEGNGR